MEKYPELKLIFASSNLNKIEEINRILPKAFTLYGLSEFGITEDIPENGLTLEENALLKAQYVHERTALNCFAEDSGLEVFALNMEPGVFSARYAGPQRSSEDNINLLLERLSNATNRKARFRTIIVLIFENKHYQFEGIIEGQITLQRSGFSGFGYDPIFIPENGDKTFAELSLDEKNVISHRAIATKKMIDFLNQKI
ncbi:MAG: RdgB/HAM1 family non-canonical purine NTP pyrophosphatase [Saprospiraceae bacterium]